MPVRKQLPGLSVPTTATITTSRAPSGQPEISELFTLADVDPVGRFEGLIVGVPGSGKTVVASTFPSPFRWIAADGKTCIKSVRWAYKAGLTSLTDPKNLVAYTPAEEVKSGHYAENATAFNKMTDMIDYWFSEKDVDNWEGGTLVIDSASEVNEWTMNLGLNINGANPTPNKPLSKSHEINKAAGLKIVSGQQDYKSSMALFESWLSDVRKECAKHNRNLLILCHEYEEDEAILDGQGNATGGRRITGVKPALHGALRDRIPKSMDDVWFMRAYNGRDFKVQLHADSTRQAKTRWGQVVNKEEPADYRQIIKKVREFHGL